MRLPHATLSWLGAVAGNTIVPLGLDRFSQSGDIPISAYRIDSDAILDMAARACLNAMREAPSRISISQATINRHMPRGARPRTTSRGSTGRRPADRADHAGAATVLLVRPRTVARRLLNRTPGRGCFGIRKSLSKAMLPCRASGCWADQWAVRSSFLRAPHR